MYLCIVKSLVRQVDVAVIGGIFILPAKRNTRP